MGFLDSILPGSSGEAQPPQAPTHSMLQNVLGMIQSHPGGLQGLIQKFESAGLGHLVSGWVSKGPNPPVTPDQVHQALGEQQIQQYAQQTGQSPQQAKGMLAQLLPHVIDQMTPSGNVPQQPMDMSGMLSMLKQKLM